MSIKMKVLGLGLIASMAVMAATVVSATAETGGHFVGEVSHTEIKGEDVVGSEPVVVFFGQTVKCSESSYTGTANEVNTTATERTITPTFHGCEVTSLETPAMINMNGCDFVVTIRGSQPESKHNTFHFVCPGEKGMVITAEGVSGHCTLEMTPNITPTGGVVYETGGSGSTHDLTINLTVSGVHVLRLSGGFFACGTFSSTDGGGSLNGKVTAKGFDTEGKQVGITATGN